VKVSKSFTKLVKVSKSFTNCKLVKVSESFTKLVKDLVKDLAKDLHLDFERTVTWETKKYSQSVVPVFPFLFALDAQVHEGDQLHWTGHNLMIDTLTACGVIVQMHSINIETGSCCHGSLPCDVPLGCMPLSMENASVSQSDGRGV
jgi:hypothetical protein